VRVVILGTGTDVGKTYVTACLARGLRMRGGHSVLALKPVESGVERGMTGDAGIIAAAAAHPRCVFALAFSHCGIAPSGSS